MEVVPSKTSPDFISKKPEKPSSLVSNDCMTNQTKNTILTLVTRVVLTKNDIGGTIAFPFTGLISFGSATPRLSEHLWVSAI